jgi:hypothetical protein
MKSNGTRYSPAFKFSARGVENLTPWAKVVLEAIKAEGKGGEAQVARPME